MKRLTHSIFASVVFALLALPGAATATTALAPEPADVLRPLMVGQSLPDVRLQDASGGWVALDDVVGDRPAVVVLESGAESPVRARQLAEMARIEPLLARLGYRVITISGADSGKSATRGTRLADPERTAARAFGLSGEAGPVPGVFVFSRTGRVVHQYVNVDTSVPMSGEVVLTAARVYRPR